LGIFSRQLNPTGTYSNDPAGSQRPASFETWQPKDYCYEDNSAMRWLSDENINGRAIEEVRMGLI